MMRFPRPALAPRGLSLALGLVLACLGAASLGAEGSVLVEETETSSEGLSSLTVRVFGAAGAASAGGGAEAAGVELKGALGGAEVFINRAYVGRAPYSAQALEPGTYLIGVEAKGYRSREFLILLKGKRSYELLFSLERLTGFLSLTVDPPDAQILVDGALLRGSLLELPIGRVSILARRFAYRERSLEVQIHEGQTTSLSLSLERSPFSVSELSASRRRFNPGNAGSLGRTRLGFEVSSYGSGRLEIRDSSDRLVYAADFPSFEDWEQGLVWTGREEGGRALPDGDYLVRLEASASGETASPFRRELRLSLDSSLVARPLGSAGALAGLRLFPETELPPAGISALDLAWRSDPGGDSVLEASVAYSFGDFLLGFAAESGLQASAGVGSGFRLGLLVPLLKGRLPRLALATRLAYVGSAENSVQNRFGAELSLPLTLSFGSLGFGLAPGLGLELRAASAGASFEAQARAGLWLAEPSYRLGLSALATFPELGAPLLARPGLEAALEARFLLGSSPLLLTGALLGSLPAEGGAELGCSLGLGLFF